MLILRITANRQIQNLKINPSITHQPSGIINLDLFLSPLCRSCSPTRSLRTFPNPRWIQIPQVFVSHSYRTLIMLFWIDDIWQNHVHPFSVRILAKSRWQLFHSRKDWARLFFIYRQLIQFFFMILGFFSGSQLAWEKSPLLVLSVTKR